MDIAAKAEDNIGKRESDKMFAAENVPQFLELDTPIIEDRRSSKYSTSSSHRKMSNQSDCSVSNRVDRGSVSSHRSFAYKKEFGSSSRKRRNRNKDQSNSVLKRMWAWTKE